MVFDLSHAAALIWRPEQGEPFPVLLDENGCPKEPQEEPDMPDPNEFETEYYTPEELERVEEHISSHFGEFETVMHELVSPDIHVDICLIPPKMCIRDSLTLDRAASTLSTGERQRMQLARSVRNRTTGVLYVLDEPSIGLHPSNIDGLTAVMHDLVADGNSVLLVDHDTQILSEADWIVEMGPEAGAGGGQVIAQGTVEDLCCQPDSQIGPYLSGKAETMVRPRTLAEQLFEQGHIHLSTGAIHTVKPLEADFPKGKLTVITGVSGSGKTTLVLESLIPAPVSYTHLDVYKRQGM